MENNISKPCYQHPKGLTPRRGPCSFCNKKTYEPSTLKMTKCFEKKFKKASIHGEHAIFGE